MGKTLFLENARKLRYEAGWVAVHRDGDPRPVLLRAEELDCIGVDGKAAFISTTCSMSSRQGAAASFSPIAGICRHQS